MTEQSGYIYILKHKNGQNVKVGETRISPKSRLEGYTETYQLKGFSIHKVFEVPLNSRQDIEKRAHSKLKQDLLSGIERAREIFACTPSKAEMAIEQAISESDIYFYELEQQKEREKTRKEKERIKQEKNDLHIRYKEIKSEEWEGSNNAKNLYENLAKFLESNPVMVKKSRPIWQYPLVLILSMFALVCVMMLFQMPYYGTTRDYWLLPWVLILIIFALGLIRSIFKEEPGMTEHKKNKEEYDKIVANIDFEKNKFLNEQTNDFEIFYKKNKK